MVLRLRTLIASSGAAVIALTATLALRSNGARAESPQKARSEDDVKRRSQAVATFAGGQVTIGEIEDSVAQQNPFMRKRYQAPGGLDELLRRTTRFAILSVEAERRGYGKAAAVQQAVKQNAVQLMLKTLVDDKLPPESVPKADIDSYYKEHLGEYVQKPVQRASQLVCATEDEAKALIAQAKDMDVRAFRELVQSKSTDDATKMRGGDLGYFDADGHVRGDATALVPAAIVKAAFALKTIDYLTPRPVKLDNGYALVKITGQRPGVSRSLSEVQDAIRIRLWRDRRQQAIEDLVARLRSEQKPEVHPELVDAIKLDE